MDIEQQTAIVGAYNDLRSILGMLEDGRINAEYISFDDLGDTIAELEERFPWLLSNTSDADTDSMDGDHDSAMASAGFGNDEDYGSAEDVL